MDIVPIILISWVILFSLVAIDTTRIEEHSYEQKPQKIEIRESYSEEITNFVEDLPNIVRENIYWHSDFEDWTMKKWEDEWTGDYYAWWGIFLTDDENVAYWVSKKYSHSWKYSSYATIKNATEPWKNKAVRFMRWTDKAWNEEWDYFPDEAYYSVFVYFPEKYDVTKDPENDPNNDWWWWNIFQFKSDNNAWSMPVVALDVYNENNNMYLWLVVKDYKNNNTDKYKFEYNIQSNPTNIPVGEWVHLEAYYKKSKKYDWEVKIWQDGKLIFYKSDIRTMLPPSETVTWWIWNYTDFIRWWKIDWTATLYFDDAIVSKYKISDYLK